MGSDERKLTASDQRKLDMFLFFMQRDFDKATAARATLAIHPLDDRVQPSRKFEKAAGKLANKFARASRNATEEECDRLATDTLRALKALAVEHGEGHYAARYDTALASES